MTLENLHVRQHKNDGIERLASMKLYLNNIAKIKNAYIELDGITVIAGENNTGKSTVGRALFAVFNGLFNIHAQIKKERTDSIVALLTRIVIITSFGTKALNDAKEVANRIVEDSHDCENRKNRIYQTLLDFLKQSGNVEKRPLDDDLFQETIDRIVEVLNISDEKFVETILNKRLQAEFCGQICNVFSEEPGTIELGIKNSKIVVHVTADGDIEIQNENSISLHTEVIYLDDPFVLDDYPQSRDVTWKFDYDHRSHLKKKLFGEKSEGNLTDEIIAKDRLGRIYDRLSAICDGEMIADKKAGAVYSPRQSDKRLDIRNLSTGLKTFVILKTLLMNGTITQNGTIILDEPEIHLHPEWQLLFAELIVLIQKEFGIHVLLNTHSPYFLNAIEVYAEKYELAGRCKYYLATSEDDRAVMEDVSDCTEKIYSKLARPLQVLENERGNL